MRNAMTLRSLVVPSERRLLIYWRRPGLSINSRRGFTRHLYPSEGLSLINWRISYAVAAACLWLPPAAPLVLCHLQLRCTCVQCPSLLVRESFRHLRLPEGFSLFCLHLFSGFAPLRRSSRRENKKSGVCATFLRLRTLFCPFKSKTGCRSADLLRFCA